jgi:amino acid transporter
MLLSFAHDGLAPKALAHTSPKTRAPDFAIWAVAIPMTLIPVIYIAVGSTDTILSSEMGTLATYGFMLAYALVCIAAPYFLFRRGESWRLAAILGGLGVLTMAFVFYVSWIPQLIHNDIFAALSWPLWILPYIFLAWAAIGLVWYSMIKRSRPEVIASAGRWGDHPETEVSASSVG